MVRLEDVYLGEKIVIWVVVTLALAVTIFSLPSVHYSAQKQPHRGIATEDLNGLFRPETKQVGAIIIKTCYRGRQVK